MNYRGNRERLAWDLQFRICSGWWRRRFATHEKTGRIPLQAGPAFVTFTPAGLGSLRASRDDSQVKPGLRLRRLRLDHKQRLDRAEAIICWQLSALGYHQHEIAAVFKVNQRCVHEVLREKKHIGTKEAAQILTAA